MDGESEGDVDGVALGFVDTLGLIDGAFVTPQ